MSTYSTCLKRTDQPSAREISPDSLSAAHEEWYYSSSVHWRGSSCLIRHYHLWESWISTTSCTRFNRSADWVPPEFWRPAINQRWEEEALDYKDLALVPVESKWHPHTATDSSKCSQEQQPGKLHQFLTSSTWYSSKWTAYSYLQLVNRHPWADDSPETSRERTVWTSYAPEACHVDSFSFWRYRPSAPSSIVRNAQELDNSRHIGEAEDSGSQCISMSTAFSIVFEMCVRTSHRVSELQNTSIAIYLLLMKL